MSSLAHCRTSLVMRSRRMEAGERDQQETERNIFLYAVANAGNFYPTSRRSSKCLFVKHLFCCFIKIVKLGTTSPFFDVELLKLEVFGRQFLKLS
jgi:hypothetical protein